MSAIPIGSGVAQGRAISDASIRRLVMLATILVVLHAVGTWSFTSLGLAAAITSVTLVAAASVVCARMAAWGAGKDAWFVIPTLLFTLVPLAARTWGLATLEGGGWAGALEFVPFLAGFAVPVLLLLLVYRALSVRSRIA